MPGRKRASKDDTALRQAYLERYAARDARKRMSRLNSGLRIRQETVDAWLRDPTFREALEEIDRRRMDEALRIATVAWPTIVEELVSIATGELPPPPNLKGTKDALEARMLVGGYQAACAKRQTQVARCAELLADILGVRRREPQTVVVNRVDTFGNLPEDLPGLVRENERLDKVLARARAELKLDDDGAS